MNFDRFMREHRETVVLGLPDTPLGFLFALYQKTGKPPYVFATRFPLRLFFFPFAKRRQSAAQRQEDILLMELSDFANRNRDKRITLIPATEEARRFAKKNAPRLEADFVIAWAE